MRDGNSLMMKTVSDSPRSEECGDCGKPDVGVKDTAVTPVRFPAEQKSRQRTTSSASANAASANLLHHQTRRSTHWAINNDLTHTDTQRDKE